MTTQLINNEGEATLTLCGRLDTAVSSQVSADINQLLAMPVSWSISPVPVFASC